MIARDDCLQEAAREKSNLSSELLALKDDIEALGQRKKLVSEQVRRYVRGRGCGNLLLLLLLLVW